MKLPIYVYLERTVAHVESRWRDSIRRDKHLKQSLTTLSFIMFSHPASGALGVMYESQYMKDQSAFDPVLEVMGWTKLHTVKAPTPHFRMEIVS